MSTKNKKQTSDYQFGSIDTKTGITREGYIKDSKMEFKEVTLWQRIVAFFKGPPKKTEMLQIVTMIEFGRKEETTYDVPVYRTYNPFTNETYKLQGTGWTSYRQATSTFDAGAWDHSKKLVLTNTRFHDYP